MQRVPKSIFFTSFLPLLLLNNDITSTALASPSLFSSQSAQRPLIQTEAGLDLPSIGLGLWNSKDKDATNAVKYAFEAGYHHLDSAAAYANEKFVGRALNPGNSLGRQGVADDEGGEKETATPPARETYWVTSKLWNTMHQPANVGKAFAQTLDDLTIPYLDLYLMHWPVAFLPNQKPGHQVVDQDTQLEDTWRAMEKLVATDPAHPEPGTTRYIGVSNFSPRQLDRILGMCRVCPYAHEFESHPYLQQQDFVNWHTDHGIRVIAYSPLANLNPTYRDKYPDLPSILEDPFWTTLAADKNVSVVQAVLGWALARNTTVIPKSVHQNYIRENIGSLAVAPTFTRDELERVAEQDHKARFNNPADEWGVELFEGLDDGSERFFPI